MCMSIMLKNDDDIPSGFKECIERISDNYPISDIVNVFDRYVSRTSIDIATAELLESFSRESLNQGRLMILLIFGRNENTNKDMIADFISERISNDYLDVYFKICPIRGRPTILKNLLFTIGFIVSISARLVNYIIRVY